MSTQARASMLEVLAELWDTKVFVNDRTNAETQDQLTDRMLDAAAEYAAPDLHRYHLQMFMEDLRDAVNARTRWEQDGILPDTIADEDYPALFSDAMVLDRVCGDVDDALFPILSGSDFPCVACRRTKASVAFWQPRETGAYCEDCRDRLGKLYDRDDVEITFDGCNCDEGFRCNDAVCVMEGDLTKRYYSQVARGMRSKVPGESYAESMILAGRGHLLRDDERDDSPEWTPQQDDLQRGYDVMWALEAGHQIGLSGNCPDCDPDRYSKEEF